MHNRDRFKGYIGPDMTAYPGIANVGKSLKGRHIMGRPVVPVAYDPTNLHSDSKMVWALEPHRIRKI